MTLSPKNVRIALVQDQLLTPAGSERVFLYLTQEFAEADVYTLAYNAETTWPEFKGLRIRTSWLNALIRTHGQFKLWFPVSTYVMQWWDLRSYDLVITSSATVAKYVRRINAPHLCYCYFPTRAIWDTRSYFGATRGLKTRIFESILSYLKKRDREAAEGVTRFVAISQITRSAIQKNYGRDSVVVPSPIDFDRFAEHAGTPKEDFYLLVSRLETWKAVDYAVKAFNDLGRSLKIVGAGPDKARLQEMAKSNVEFLGKVDDAALALLYARARAVVFTPVLEYGLVPLEANAAGTPCIAYGRGGVLETMIGLDDAEGRAPTAILFDRQSSESLADAVLLCERTTFDSSVLCTHAAQYNVPAFQKRLRALSDELLVDRSARS